MTGKPTATAEGNAEVIDAMRDYVYRDEKSLEARLAEVVAWADSVKPDLKDLKSAMFATVSENADSIAFQIGALMDGRKDSTERREKLNAEYQGHLLDKGNLALDVSITKTQVEELCAPLSLDISCELVDQDAAKPKFKYSNDSARAAALIVALKDNDDYGALVKQQREQERKLAHARAMIESLDREIKSLDAESREYGRRIDALVARLNNLTARFR